jgi:hypothetical protein
MPEPEPVQRLRELLDRLKAARGERTDDPERRRRLRESSHASSSCPGSTSAGEADRLASVMTALRALPARIGRFVRQLPSPLPWLIALAAPAWQRAASLANRAVEAVMGIGVATHARPLKIFMLSLVTLASGGLGLMVAYAATPDAPDEQVLVTTGESYTIATVTGPGGTTTVAVTKTKDGRTKLTPVHLTRTVDGPGETERVLVDVVGDSVVLRDTDTRLITQIATQRATQTQIATQTWAVTAFEPVAQTQVVTQRVTETQVVMQPVTETLVVTQSKGKPKTHTLVETVTVTETKEITVTETVGPAP